MTLRSNAPLSNIWHTVKEASMLVMGIDPGAKGWAVVIDDGLNIVWDVPLPDSPGAFKRLLEDGPVPAVVGVEKQCPFPQQGVVSTFKIGYAFGWTEGVIASMGWKYLLVRPQDWQKVMLLGLPRGKTRIERESNVLAAAERLLGQSLRGPRGGKLVDKAAAYLIAVYVKRHLGLDKV